MNHQRNGCNHDQHHHRNGINKNPKVDVKFIGQVEPCGIESNNLFKRF